MEQEIKTYRLLERGEILLATDQWLNGPEWTIIPEGVYINTDGSILFRREDNGKGKWPLLNQDDAMQDGDEVYVRMTESKIEWVKVDPSYYGWPVSTSIVRRPRPEPSVKEYTWLVIQPGKMPLWHGTEKDATKHARKLAIEDTNKAEYYVAKCSKAFRVTVEVKEREL